MLLCETEMAECPGCLNCESSLQRGELLSCSRSTPRLAPEACPGKAPHHPTSQPRHNSAWHRNPLGNAGPQPPLAAENRWPSNISFDPFLLGDESRFSCSGRCLVVKMFSFNTTQQMCRDRRLGSSLFRPKRDGLKG